MHYSTMHIWHLQTSCYTVSSRQYVNKQAVYELYMIVVLHDTVCIIIANRNQFEKLHNNLKCKGFECKTEKYSYIASYCTNLKFESIQSECISNFLGQYIRCLYY